MISLELDLLLWYRRPRELIIEDLSILIFLMIKGGEFEGRGCVISSQVLRGGIHEVSRGSYRKLEIFL